MQSWWAEETLSISPNLKLCGETLTQSALADLVETSMKSDSAQALREALGPTGNQPFAIPACSSPANTDQKPSHLNECRSFTHPKTNQGTL